MHFCTKFLRFTVFRKETDTRRHCAILNPELLPFGLAEGQAGRRLHSRLWDARKLAHKLARRGTMVE